MKLHQELLELRKTEKQISADILEKLQLMENRRSYLCLGYSSLFDYLVRGLGYSQSRAYERQSCLRLTKEMPELKQKIDQGKLSYSTLSVAFKSLKKKTTEDKRFLLKQLENKPIREVKKILAEPAKPIIIKQSIYQDKVHLRLELSHELHEKLEKLKALKSHQGDLEILLEKLIDKELKQFEVSPIKQNKSQSLRYIPKKLRNHLLEKAKYRCEYPGCESEHYLQVDHVTPVRLGGKATQDNLQILCSAHNQMKG